MTQKIRSITIVGGGTAGWMSAVYLQRVLGNTKLDPVRVRVIESEDIGILGVGEATIPTIRQIMRACAIPEWRLLKEADASFKHGIKFADWLLTPAAGKPRHTYYHPFEPLQSINGYNMMQHWLNLKERGVQVPAMHDAASIQPGLAEQFKSPKLFNSEPYDAPLPYAFHLDAVKLARLLRDVGIERGIEHVVDNVTDVRLDDTGNIKSLVTEKSGQLTADFYIDCSGFRALLIEKHLKEPFVSLSDALLCDSAVAMPLTHGDERPKIRPFTTCTAKPAGWIWEIDLFTRRGNGYVYSSAHTSEDQATSELIAHLGVKEADAAPRHLKMRVGYRKRTWVKNCLAIGLSAGFIEPLESTGIYMIERAIMLFVDYISAGFGSEVLARKYNAVSSAQYLEICDFVQLHYLLSLRDDSQFWLDNRHALKVSDALRARLELWNYKIPSTTDLDAQLTTFGPNSYFYILAGMRQLPQKGANLSPYIDPEASAAALDYVNKTREKALAASPDHYEYLNNIRARAA